MSRLCFNAFNSSPWTGAGVPLRDQIAAAADAGFAAIGLDRFTLEAFEADGGRIAEVEQWLGRAGIRCGVVTAAMLGADPQALRGVGYAADRARALGAPFIQVNMAAPAADQQAMLEQAVQAAGDGVRLAIEYLPTTTLCRVGDTVALARAVGFDRAGAMIDVWHHERGPDSWDDLAAVPLEAIAYVEFDDALPPAGDPAQDMMDDRTFPGEGVFDLHRFAAAIDNIGYRGMVSVEILNAEWRSRDIRAFAARAFSTSEPYWKGTRTG